nr:iron-sulfur cluster assembly accessory protein [Ancylothrix sp. D3o]
MATIPFLPIPFLPLSNYQSMINLSKTAQLEINRLKSKQANPSAKFRLGVQPGGCAGFYYTMELDEVVREDDQLWECNGVQVLVNAESLPYVNGLNVDYSEDLMGGGFRFNNPNAAQSCSCGHSFSL